MNIRATILSSLALGAGAIALGSIGSSLGACSVKTSDCGDGGTCVTAKTQPETDGSLTSKTSMRAWKADDVIEIQNGNGAVIVHGDPNATTISVSMTPFAHSDSGGDADSKASIADAIASLTIDETNPNKFYVHCDRGGTHGTSQAANSGCKNLTVTIPAGSATAGLTLLANTNAGDVTAPDALTAKAGQYLIFTTGAGSVSVSNVSGGVKAHTEVGDATANCTPAVGGTVEVSSGNGDVTLSLPANFAADHVTLKGDPINVTGFGSDFTKASTTRGAAGTGASSVTVSTDLGSVTVKAQ
jgi:hypothetical protein